MKSVAILLLGSVLFSTPLLACPKGSSPDEHGYEILHHIQDEVSVSIPIINAKDLPQGRFSCVNYKTLDSCYVLENETVGPLESDSHVLIVFGRMMGNLQELPLQDHDGVIHNYFKVKDRVIVKASLTPSEEESEPVLNYLECRLLK